MTARILPAMSAGAVAGALPRGHGAAPAPSFPPEVLQSTAQWIQQLALSWHSEVPERLHSSEIDAGGAPELHSDFVNYIERPCNGRAWCSKPTCPIEGKHRCHDMKCSHGVDRITDPRHRTQRAFRRLRRAAPREFDVMYLLCARGMHFHEVAAALTERAIRINKPERYSEGAVLVLAVSAVDKLAKWY